MSATVGLIIVVLGLVLEALGSLAEAVVLSANRLRVRAYLQGSADRGAAVNRLLSQPGRVLRTLVFINSLAAVISAAVGTQLAVRYWSDALGPWATLAGIAVIFAVLLVFGELLPKAIASQWSEPLARVIVQPVTVLTQVLHPIVYGLELLTGLFLRPFGWKGAAAPMLVSEEEVHLLLTVGQEQGLIEQEELTMIDNIFELEETTVREVMVPRVDIVAADMKSDPNDVIRLIIETGYSRIPVYDETVDRIVGIVYAKDVLEKMFEGQPIVISEIARAAFYVPESRRVDELLHDLQERKVHLAIAIDEYGGTAGLVTIEDLIEEIVGDIRDEYDPEELAPTWSDDGAELTLPGRLSLDEFTEVTGIELEDTGVGTIGGLLATRLGRIPEPGDSVSIPGGKLTVHETVGRRIHTVVFTRDSEPEPEMEENP